MSNSRTSFRGHWVAVRAMLVITVVLGVAYPLGITAIGQLVLPWQSNGSLVRVNGAAVGSSLIGQSFTDADGKPMPRYLQPRPSAAGKGYDAGSSGASNFGPENPKLIAAIKERKSEVAAFNGVDPKDVPADAVTASSSGLDPHISPEYALLQVPRIAAARGIAESEVRQVVESKFQARDLGYLGEPTVNVLLVNVALDELKE